MEKRMELKDIKNKVGARGSIKEYYEPTEVAMPKEPVKRDGFFERQRKSSEKRQQKKLKQVQKKHTYMQKKYGTRLETQRLKTEMSELKQRQRASSPFGKIPAGLSKVFSKPDRSIRAREQSVASRQLAVRTERQLSRQQMEQEREYHKKFPVRQEGDGELPYYEKDYQKPLPKRAAAAQIGITNHKNIPKKKSFKDELF
jgi:hypothetical protein